MATRVPMMQRVSEAHLDLVATIVIDAFIIAVAILCRSGVLWLFDHLTNNDSWALTALKKITDIGMVLTALLYTIADLLKRVINVWKELGNGTH